MRIQCPNCQSIYDVPETRLEGRRTVRCARCSQSFAPVPTVPDLVALPDPPPEVPSPEPPATEPVPILAPLPVLTRLSRHSEPEPPPDRVSRAFPWLTIAWGLSLASVALLLVLLLLDRTALAAAWPPLQRLYGVIGLG